MDRGGSIGEELIIIKQALLTTSTEEHQIPTIDLQMYIVTFSITQAAIHVLIHSKILSTLFNQIHPL